MGVEGGEEGEESSRGREHGVLGEGDGGRKRSERIRKETEGGGRHCGVGGGDDTSTQSKERIIVINTPFASACV